MKHIRTEYILGIHIPVPGKVAQRIKRMQEIFGMEYPGNYVGEPHITLYLANFPKKNFAELILLFRALRRGPVRVTLNSMQKKQAKNSQMFVCMPIKKTNRICNLHKSVIRIANQLRDGLIRHKDKIRMRGNYYTKKERGYIVSYGYARVLDNFDPHITIGNIHASELKKSKKEIREHLCFFRGMSFVAGSIDVGLYEYDIKRKAYIGSRVKKIQL